MDLSVLDQDFPQDQGTMTAFASSSGWMKRRAPPVGRCKMFPLKASKVLRSTFPVREFAVALRQSGYGPEFVQDGASLRSCTQALTAGSRNLGHMPVIRTAPPSTVIAATSS